MNISQCLRGDKELAGRQIQKTEREPADRECLTKHTKQELYIREGSSSSQPDFLTPGQAALIITKDVWDMNHDLPTMPCSHQ